MGARVVRVVPALLAVAFFPVASVAVDLNGKWLFGTQIVTITQTGSSLTIPFFVPFTGTIDPTDPDGFTNYAVSYNDPSLMAEMVGRVTPSGNLLDGRLASSFGGMFFVQPVVGTRCTCDDGNTTDGDGCDATCQVEPCWTCTGEPSVCSPVGDGGACDDRQDCTTGEACTAGVCGGGTPVSPCIDMTGLWNRHREIPGLGVVEDSATNVTQRGGDVRMGAHVGAIDPATGVFDLRTPHLDLFCFGFSPLLGTVATDGLTYVSDGFIDQPDELAPDHCDSFALSETGTRCGTSTKELGEECDDGNLADGDGCSAECLVEQCWTCSGETSSCAPAGAGPCDDGSACTSDDTCAGDGSCAGTLVACAPCLQCDAALGCVAQPLSPCKASATPRQSLLRIKNDADDAKDSFLWKWNDGEATTLAELGDPPGGDDVSVCLYDESGPTTLLFRATMPGGALCGDEPCWKATGSVGFGYKNSDTTPEGVLVARLKSGTPAKAKVKGKGVHLSDRAAGLPSLPLAEQLRVQLQGANGLCLETLHDGSTVLKNDAAKGLFKARGAP